MKTSYKEKYEDILARLAKAKNDNEVCDERFCCVINEIIPELAESEDERIRKGIIELVKQSSEILNKKNQERMLAWLEKQEGCELIRKEWLEHIKQSWYKEGFIDGKYGGGTSKEWTINDTTTLNELIDFLENGTAKLQHDLTRYANWLKIQFTPIEKQGEQKSIDDLIPQEAMDIAVAKCFEQGEQNPVIEMKSAEESMGIDSDTYNKIVDECIFGEQKPEENKGNIGGISPNWSEKDEAVLDALIRRLEGEDVYVSPHLAVECLKSIKGRVGCEANCTTTKEWSEEDEQHIDSLLKRLDSLCKNKFERTRFAISEDREWLKSLRPQNTYNPYKAVVESIAEMCKHYDKASHSGLRDFYDNVKVKCKEAQEYDKMIQEFNV